MAAAAHQEEVIPAAQHKGGSAAKQTEYSKQSRAVFAPVGSVSGIIL